ncbi:MAG: ATPase [Rhizobiales bacterium]|nr:ATPase [Hyphomicrobiales bacterium]
MPAGHSIDLDRDPRAIIAVREFDAPRELVFEAWTDRKHLAQWWGPDGFTTTTSLFDMRVGGVWRFVMHGPDGRDYENRITFDEIVRPERIRYHHGGGDDVEPVQFHTTVTFEDFGSSRTRITLHAVFPSAAERDRVVKDYGAAEGAAQTLARLADYLADYLATMTA